MDTFDHKDLKGTQHRKIEVVGAHLRSVQLPACYHLSNHITMVKTDIIGTFFFKKETEVTGNSVSNNNKRKYLTKVSPIENISVQPPLEIFPKISLSREQQYVQRGRSERRRCAR